MFIFQSLYKNWVLYEFFSLDIQLSTLTVRKGVTQIREKACAVTPCAPRIVIRGESFRAKSPKCQVQNDTNRY